MVYIPAQVTAVVVMLVMVMVVAVVIAIAVAAVVVVKACRNGSYITENSSCAVWEKRPIVGKDPKP